MSRSKKDDKQHDDDEEVFLGYIEPDDAIQNEISSDQNIAVPIEQISDHKHKQQQQPDDQPECPWLVNKIGGTPIFPCSGINVNHLVNALESLSCKQCKKPCVLVAQINSPIDDSPIDRVMQVYCCVEVNCSKHTWFSLRCMIDNNIDNKSVKPNIDLSRFPELELDFDSLHGPVIACRRRCFFKPYYISVLEEPTGREDFTRNNLEAMKLAARFNDPDMQPAAIESKYKNVKNYQPPQQPANKTDLEEWEKFQMEKLYGSDKVMYRFYKRLNQYPSQILRYCWEGQPLLNSTRIKIDVRPCSLCSAKRKFELQIMSAVINYLKTDNEFDKEIIDFSSIIVHSCGKNCSKASFTIEDTFFMPDPDSRTFNKVKQRLLAVKLKESDPDAMMVEPTEDETNKPQQEGSSRNIEQPFVTVSKKNKKGKKNKNKK